MSRDERAEEAPHASLLACVSVVGATVFIAWRDVFDGWI